MPYHLRGNCVVKGTKASPGATIKCHKTHPQALAHLAALVVNVEDATFKTIDSYVTVHNVLQSTVHKAFTVAADTLYGLGYMTQEERIKLSNGIGKSLDSMSETMDALHMDTRLVMPHVAEAMSNLIMQRPGASSLFTIKDGDVDRWIAVSTAEVWDRQDEMMTIKSMDWDIAYAKKTGIYPELRMFHVRGFKLGICDSMDRIGIYAVDKGYWNADPFAQAVKDRVVDNKGRWKVSRGFYPIESAGWCTACSANLTVGLVNYSLGVMCPVCKAYYPKPNALKDLKVFKSITFDITVTDAPVVAETGVAAYTVDNTSVKE